MNARSLSTLSALLLGGCSLLFGVDDYDVATQSDAGQRDAGARDAGALDAGGLLDAGSTDAGEPLDAGELDSGRPDSGPDGLPDLTIGCGTPAEIVKGGDVVRVPWTVGNIGLVPGGPLTVAVLMERPAMTDDEVDEYVEVGTARIPTRVALSGSETGEVAFTAPDWVLGGENAIRCVVDSLEEVSELDESNNHADTFLVASGLPDLVASSVSVWETRDSTSQMPTAVIHYLVHNDGSTAARAVGFAVYVGYEDQGGAGSQCAWMLDEIPFIAASAPVSGTAEITWTRDDCSGYPYNPNTATLFVDPSSTIAETNESNNSMRINYIH